MNYRHAFHAGNFADVMKHAVLACVVDSLKSKDKPFAILDTHAGIGRYDFWKLAPNKTDEYKDGIERLWDTDATPNGLAPYIAVLRAMNGKLLRHYPGSPYLVRQLMRPCDKLILAEKHPEDAETLKALFHADKQVAIHHMDGWQALKAFLPPKEKRGIVLIDPAFEEKGEYDRLGKSLIEARQRWPQGIFIGWYPIKDQAEAKRMKNILKESGIPGILAVELQTATPDPDQPLSGAGLILINPPYKLEESLDDILPFLARKLSRGDGAGATVDWLVKDV